MWLTVTMQLNIAMTLTEKVSDPVGKSALPMRLHCTNGSGRPVALHTNSSSVPSSNVLSLLV